MQAEVRDVPVNAKKWKPQEIIEGPPSASVLGQPLRIHTAKFRVCGHFENKLSFSPCFADTPTGASLPVGPTMSSLLCAISRPPVLGRGLLLLPAVPVSEDLNLSASHPVPQPSPRPTPGPGDMLIRYFGAPMAQSLPEPQQALA